MYNKEKHIIFGTNELILQKFSNREIPLELRMNTSLCYVSVQVKFIPAPEISLIKMEF